MNKYNDIDKEIFPKLRDQDVGDIKLLGNTIQMVFFRAEETALLVDCSNHKAMLFSQFENLTSRKIERLLQSWSVC